MLSGLGKGNWLPLALFSASKNENNMNIYLRMIVGGMTEIIHTQVFKTVSGILSMLSKCQIPLSMDFSRGSRDRKEDAEQRNLGARIETPGDVPVLRERQREKSIKFIIRKSIIWWIGSPGWEIQRRSRFEGKRMSATWDMLDFKWSKDSPMEITNRHCTVGSPALQKRLSPKCSLKRVIQLRSRQAQVTGSAVFRDQCGQVKGRHE